MDTNKLSGKPDEMLGVLTYDGLASNLRGVAKLLVTSYYKPGTTVLSFFLTRSIRFFEGNNDVHRGNLCYSRRQGR